MMELRCRGRTGYAAALLVLALAAHGVAAGAATAEPLVFHASQSGQRTLDQGEGGGNPFASALIELLARPSLQLAELPVGISRLTAAKSRNFQKADVPAAVTGAAWQVLPVKPGERRIALVMVVSDYAASGGSGVDPAPSLAGAKRDAERVAKALETAGFKTQLAIDLSLPRMEDTLAKFAAESAGYDAAVIYTTGHGVDVGGSVYLLPGDYPMAQRNGALPASALRLSEIGEGLRAKHVNLLFYGGCRDNPLAD
jgi:Caspase domain